MITSTAVELESIPNAYLIVGGIIGVIAIIALIIYIKASPSVMDTLPVMISAGFATAVFSILALNNVYESNVESIESHYSVVITSENGWWGIYPVTGINEDKIEKHEVTFNDGSPKEEFDELKGEVKVKGDRAVLFYAPDSPDEMVPYEAE